MLRLPTRGALGNGLRVTAGAVLASGGKLAVITRGVRLELKPQRDGSTIAKRIASDRQTGTRVEISFDRRCRMILTPSLGPTSPSGWPRAAVPMPGSRPPIGTTAAVP